MEWNSTDVSELLLVDDLLRSRLGLASMGLARSAKEEDCGSPTEPRRDDLPNLGFLPGVLGVLIASH